MNFNATHWRNNTSRHANKQDHPEIEYKLAVDLACRHAIIWPPQAKIHLLAHQIPLRNNKDRMKTLMKDDNNYVMLAELYGQLLSIHCLCSAPLAASTASLEAHPKKRDSYKQK